MNYTKCIEHWATKNGWEKPVLYRDGSGNYQRLVDTWEDDRAIPSDDALKAVWSDVQAEIAAVAYVKARREAYLSTGDQLDMQYWDAVNGTTTWKDHVAKVKSDSAKPD